MDHPNHTTPPQVAQAETSRDNLLTSTSLSTPVSGMRTMWGLISAYWRSSEKKKAWLLIGALAATIAMDTGMTAGMAFLIKDITDAAQARDVLNLSTAISAASAWAIYSVGFPLVSGWRDYIHDIWKIEWKGWFRDQFHQARSMGNAISHIDKNPGPVISPDQIMSEGIEQLIDAATELGKGLSTSVVKLATFTGVLAVISYQSPISVGEYHMGPGASFCIGYGLSIGMAVAQTLFNKYFGKKLDKLNFKHTVATADYRAREVRINNYAGQIAAYGGKAVICHGLDESFEKYQVNNRDLAKTRLHFNIATRSYGLQAGFGYFIGGAALFALTNLSWGQGAQRVATISDLHNNFAFFGNVIPDYSKAKSWVKRMTDYASQIELAQDPKKFYSQTGSRADISVASEKRDSILFKDIVIDDPAAHAEVLKIPDLEIQPGHRYLLTGEVGREKSALLKIPFHQWYYGEGECMIPDHKSLMLTSGYVLPDATLRENIAFPENDTAKFSEAAYENVLHEAHLDHLIPFLDEKSRKGETWEALDKNEKQKLDFARAFLHKPNYLFLDEPTAAMDSHLQHEILGKLPKLLPETAILASVNGDIDSISSFFTEHLQIQDDKSVKISSLTPSADNLINFPNPAYPPPPTPTPNYMKKAM